ncbi:MAG: cytochrome c [Acidobacteria bacterium]|nr:MAG: cytochrome c [Acidobacteriota bacterium]
MTKGLVIAGMIVLLVLGGGAAVWVHSAHGFSAKAKPTWIEAELAQLSRRLALPSSKADVKNPDPATPQQLAAAGHLFATQCAVCHNTNGDGHTTMGQSMYPHVPDLRGLTQNKSDGTLFYTIRNGIRMSGMPAWSQESDPQIWGLVNLIRTFKPNPR